MTRQLDEKIVEAPKAEEIAAKSKPRDPEPTREAKDLMYGNKAYKRTVRDTSAERDLGYARLHTFGGTSNVQMFWDFHPEAVDRQLFKLRVGSQEVILSAIELQKYLRWV